MTYTGTGRSGLQVYSSRKQSLVFASQLSKAKLKCTPRQCTTAVDNPGQSSPIAEAAQLSLYQGVDKVCNCHYLNCLKIYIVFPQSFGV